MPHVIIEYSANLDRDIVPAEMMHCLHQAAIETGVFPVKGIKTRLVRRDAFVVGGGVDAEAGFVFIVARMRPGRSPETHKRVTTHLMTALRSFLELHHVRRPLGLNIEVEEINTDTYAQFSTVSA